MLSLAENMELRELVSQFSVFSSKKAVIDTNSIYNIMS